MYNNFNFISSEILIAEVKQELSSYFDSGSLTETLMPSIIDNALRRLRVLTLEYNETFLALENYRGKLPTDATLVKDAFLCNNVTTITNPVGTTVYEYYKKIYCNDTCNNEYEVFEQTTAQVPSWVTTNMHPSLLRIYYGSKSLCSDDCAGIKLDAADMLKINGKTITATFETGTLYLQYYSRPEDDFGPLIPEIVEVEEYIKAALYFNLFKILYNSVTDESINIIERKLAMYRAEYYQKYESALNTLKEETKQEVRDAIHKQRRRFIQFTIN